MIFIGVSIIGVFAAGLLMRNALLGYAALLMLVIARGWRNNTMMAYVENKAYGVGKK